MEISDRIKQRMAEIGVKGVDITKGTGVSSGGVSQWVNGITKPNGEKLLALSRVLECNPEWLLTGRTDLATSSDAEQVVPVLSPSDAVKFLDDRSVPDKIKTMPALIKGSSHVAFGLIEETEQFEPAIPVGSIYYVTPLKIMNPKMLALKTVLVRIDNHLLAGKVKALSMGRFTIALADGSSEPLPSGLKHVVGLISHIQLP